MTLLEIFGVAAGAELPKSSGGRRRWFRHDRRGSVLIVVAIAAMALVSVVALVVDVGMLLLAHREAQRAADSGALAGASAYLDFDPVDPATTAIAADSAWVRAHDYAERHTMLHIGIVANEVTVDTLLSEQRVRVTVHRPAIPLFFARLFGINTAGVSATAVAEAVQAGAATDCVKPFAVPDMWDERSGSDINGNHIWEFEQLDPAHPQDALEPWEFNPGTDYYDREKTGYYTDWRGSDTKPQDSGVYWNPASGSTGGYVPRSYDKDAGRRIPLKLQYPGAGSSPSLWFSWDLPGANGAAGVIAGIKGCSDFAVSLDSTITPETGMTSNPIYKAFRDLIDGTNGVSTNNPKWDPRDPYAYWDDAAGMPMYPATGSLPAQPVNPDHSARVFTVALFDPNDMYSGKHEMKFVNFAKVFLEDPDVLYGDPTKSNYISQQQQRPIVGRLMKFAKGVNASTTGTLVKRIRLVG